MNIGDIIKFFRSGFSLTLETEILTTDRTLQLPNKTGVIATLDDIGSGGGSTQIVTKTASGNILASDVDKFLLCGETTTINLTVQPNSTIAIPTGSEVEITQDNTGIVNIVAGSGVTIRSEGSPASTNTFRLLGQYSVATLKKVGADSWRIYGGVAW